MDNPRIKQIGKVNGDLLESGCHWGNGDLENWKPHIKMSLHKAIVGIHKDSNGVLTQKDFVLTVNEKSAELMMRIPEILLYIEASPFAREHLKKNKFLSFLYGFNFKVAESVSLINGKTFEVPDSTAFLLLVSPETADEQYVRAFVMMEIF
jgi:hypothetical protein